MNRSTSSPPSHRSSATVTWPGLLETTDQTAPESSHRRSSATRSISMLLRLHFHDRPPSHHRVQGLRHRPSGRRTSAR
ncbi:hypothetical protein DVS77_05100 [Mycolicibacterium moriokaense]|nr:hypothetical protein DVS77_05100 [Mycolicibacterium moriokaense]